MIKSDIGRVEVAHADKISGWMLNVSVVAFFAWLGLLGLIMHTFEAERVELYPTEINASIAAFIVMSTAMVARSVHASFQRSRLGSKNGGIKIAIFVVWIISMLTNALCATTPVPVVLDPMTGVRVHLVRWCEWAILAGLMTFLTDSIDSTGVKGPIALGMSQLGSTMFGIYFPFAGSTYIPALAVCFALFFFFPYRTKQRYGSYTKMDKLQASSYYGKLKSGAMRLNATCLLCWSVFVVNYFAQWAIQRGMVGEQFCATGENPGLGFASDSSLLSQAFVTTVIDCFVDVLSKFAYATVILERYDASDLSDLFDPASLDARRLKELRAEMEDIWTNVESDVLIIVEGHPSQGELRIRASNSLGATLGLGAKEIDATLDRVAKETRATRADATEEIYDPTGVVAMISSAWLGSGVEPASLHDLKVAGGGKRTVEVVTTELPLPESKSIKRQHDLLRRILIVARNVTEREQRHKDEVAKLTKQIADLKKP